VRSDLKPCSRPRRKPSCWSSGGEGKFSAKATGWDENKVIKPGEKIEISLAEGHWLIVKVPPPAVEADPAQDAFVQHLL
jgi:hypothetical protein